MILEVIAMMVKLNSSFKVGFDYEFLSPPKSLSAKKKKQLRDQNKDY